MQRERNTTDFNKLLLRKANGVVDCLSKHAQHKLNGCRRKSTDYSDE